MALLPQPRLVLPRTHFAWARLYCRLLALFAPQGAAILAAYGVLGLQARPEELPFGLQLDPLHGAVHLAVGLLGGYVGFLRPAASIPTVRAFGLFFLLLAFLGTFTDLRLGMQLEAQENGLHWPLAVIASAIGFAPALLPAWRGR